MKIAKEMLSTDGKYKSVIVLRDDGLYEAGWQYCDLGGRWSSTSISSSTYHLTDTLDNAVKMSEVQLNTLPGRELDGITVNERLVIKGLDTEFNDAINTRNRQEAIAILIKVRLTEEQAKQTVDAIFNNPKYYGYKKK